MQIHRSAHSSGFTILPNELLQDRRLTYLSRGVLVDLLSRPEGWREDGRRIADTSPQGRLAVAKALRELTAAGYYRVDRIRLPDGTFRSEAHVWDVPQLVVPGATDPGSGEPDARGCGANPVKNPQKEPTLPVPPDPATREAVALLHRVLRPEPRLRLGTLEAQALAPLVATWLERGSTPAELANALLPGLPAPLHSAAALLRDRLTRKMPPPPPPPPAPQTECDDCGVPLRHPGLCRACAGHGSRPVAVGQGEAATPQGAARARAALHSGSPAGTLGGILRGAFPAHARP